MAVAGKALQNSSLADKIYTERFRISDSFLKLS
jgi:hypothetical protein